MKIAVDNIIFQDKKYILEASVLLATLIELRHQLIFPKNYHLSYQTLTQGTNWKYFRAEYKNSAFFTSIVKDFTASAYQKPDIYISTDNLAKALVYLRSPLYILVENEFNDCHFIEAIIKHFGDNYTKMAYQNKWIAFKHAGGTGEVYKFIEKELKNSSTNLSPRLFAILDSDAKTKEERLDTAKPVKKNIQKLCKENRILETHLHILYKREMENYLPLSLIEKLAQKNGIYEYKNKNKKPFNNFLAAFKKLTDEQKDYFDIENGFNFKEFSIKEASLKEFLKKYQEAHNSNKNNVIKNYSTKLLTSEHKEKKIRIPSSFFFTNNQITEKDKHTLQSGFQLFFDTKAEFSSLFEDTTKAELESRCAHHPTNGKNELQIIADKIKNLL